MKNLIFMVICAAMLTSCATTHWKTDKKTTLRIKGFGQWSAGYTKQMKYIPGFPVIYTTVSNPTNKTAKFEVICMDVNAWSENIPEIVKIVELPPNSDTDVTFPLTAPDGLRIKTPVCYAVPFYTGE